MTQTLLNSFTIVFPTDGQPWLQGKRSAADAASGRTDGSFIDTLG